MRYNLQTPVPDVIDRMCFQPLPRSLMSMYLGKLGQVNQPWQDVIYLLRCSHSGSAAGLCRVKCLYCFVHIRHLQREQSHSPCLVLSLMLADIRCKYCHRRATKTSASKGLHTGGVSGIWLGLDVQASQRLSYKCPTSQGEH